MQNYLLYLSYRGSNYSGYQIQANANTVGAEILEALKTIFGSVEKLVGCSRTDSGVHALCYALSFKSDKIMSPGAVIKAMNNNLPYDISVFDCRYVADSFHARYDVKLKEYIYKIYNTPERDPFLNDFMLHYPWHLDIKKMNSAAEKLLGTHDFSSFMAAGSKISDCVRTVYTAYFEKDGDIVTFHISADGFLYKMVRLIVGTLLYVSSGKLGEHSIPEILNSGKQTPGPAAAAKGLYLSEVKYKQ